MILSVSHVQKTYPHPSAPIQVLRGVNLDAQAGETIAILGPSGSGKSTLLSLLAGLDSPTSGSVTLAGKNLTAMNEESLARFRAKNLGIIFQQFHLMNNLTAKENVRLPLEISGTSEADAKARQALIDVGLGHRLDHFPHQLSGGECQRVAIARAIVVEPPLLLADEPSGNLDTTTGHQVMKLLFDLTKKNKMTLILVTHNEDLAKWCDKKLTLSEGRLVS
jgi:putative ABC transport system ATP-binding protein